MYFSSFLLSIASLFRVGSFQGRWNGFQIGGAMEHWNILSATMVSWQEKMLNSRHSRVAKTVIFWPWWQSFNCFCIETFFFSFVSLFYFWHAKMCAWGAWAPGPRPPSSSVASPAVWTLFIEGGLFLFLMYFSLFNFFVFSQPRPNVEEVDSSHFFITTLESK